MLLALTLWQRQRKLLAFKHIYSGSRRRVNVDCITVTERGSMVQAFFRNGRVLYDTAYRVVRQKSKLYQNFGIAASNRPIGLFPKFGNLHVL